MEFCYELLKGLPAYTGGNTSVGLYDAGRGLEDDRVVEALPLPIDNGASMTAEEFKAAVDALIRACGGVWENSPSGRLSVKVFFNQRVWQLRHENGTVTAFCVDEYMPTETADGAHLRAVIHTNADEFAAYIDRLKDAGFAVTFENAIEGNLYRELKKDGRRLYAYYTAGDGTARFIDDTVGHGIVGFGYRAEGAAGATELYQYALRQAWRVNGSVTDCGMLYVLKLSDGSLFLVDGGAYEQATDEAVEHLYAFLRERTATKAGDKLRIAGWFCTHAHNDHMDLFGKLLRLHHEEIDLERVLFNFPSSRHYRLSPLVYTCINRIRKYYPHVRYLKPHSGHSFTLADATFEVLHTHEDYMSLGCDELPEDFNDTSTVVKVTFEGKTFLILGDTNRAGEAQLLRHYTADTLKVDIVQAAHHVFNMLYYLYEVTDPTYILAPTRPESKTNHDRVKYRRLILSRDEDKVYFSSEAGTVGFAVREGALEPIYHDVLHGGDFDGSDL